MEKDKEFAERRNNFDHRKRINRDVIQVRPFKVTKFVKERVKVAEDVNSGQGFLANLGYRVDGAVKATYKSPFLSQEQVCFDKPLSMVKNVEEMKKEDEDQKIKKVRKYTSICTSSRVIKPKTDERDQYVMMETYPFKWFEEDIPIKEQKKRAHELVCPDQMGSSSNDIGE
jgi:hypothetical protein